MLFTQWLNELTNRVLRKRVRTSAQKRRRASRRATPMPSEVLENRVLPTIFIDLDATGLLAITSDAGNDSNVTLKATIGSIFIAENANRR